MNVQQLATELQEYIKTGRILEAMERFYDPGVRMQENGNAPTVGLAANVEREKQFLGQVKQWKGYTVRSLAASGDTALVESVIEFVNTSGQDVRIEQVSVTRWAGGRIVHERFYYDSAAK